jgi:hypothetical protein
MDRKEDRMVGMGVEGLVRTPTEMELNRKIEKKDVTI